MRECEVWTLKEVEQLLVLAQQGRQLLGLPEQAALILHLAIGWSPGLERGAMWP